MHFVILPRTCVSEKAVMISEDAMTMAKSVLEVSHVARLAISIEQLAEPVLQASLKLATVLMLTIILIEA